MLYALLCGVSLAMDALAIAVSLGLACPRPRLLPSLAVAGSFGLFQCLMPLLGAAAAAWAAVYAARLGPYISFLLLVTVGNEMVSSGLRAHWTGESAELEDAYRGGRLRPLRLLTLSVATSLDALAVGISVGLDPLFCPGLGLLPLCLLIGLVTFVCCFAGFAAGSRLSAAAPWRAELAGGVVLCCLGLKMLVEGLLAQ